MFPRSAGTGSVAQRDVRRSRRAAAVRRRHGLRRAVPAADPPDRPQLPQGPRTTRSRPARMIPAARGRSAPRPAGTRRSNRGSARSTISIASSQRRARTASRSRSTSPTRLARSSRRSRSTRSGSAGARTARSSTPRTRRRSIRTSIRSTSSRTTGRRCGHELKSVIEFWIGHGVKIFRVDNPHTKPFRFWEWAIAEIKRAIPGHDLPVGGVHAAEGDAVPRQVRLLAVVHLLHLAKHAARS